MNRWVTALLLLAAPASRAADAVPVLVELFTAEGCSSCPLADEALMALVREQPAAGVEVIPLELHVDYWNSQGWTDPFSFHDVTLRQEHYATAAAGNASQLITPQWMVDGTHSFLGTRELMQLLETIQQSGAHPKRSVRADLRPAQGGVDVELRVGPGEAPPALLWVVVTESGLSSNVTRGENQGRTLAHAPVVRSLQKVATVPQDGWTGTVRLAIAEPWRRDALRVVAFAQEPGSGKVVGIGATRVPAPTTDGGH